jgi:hypothetical protein
MMPSTTNLVAQQLIAGRGLITTGADYKIALLFVTPSNSDYTYLRMSWSCQRYERSRCRMTMVHENR